MGKDVTYIAGPITGIDDFKSNFDKAADLIKARGIIPLSPAMLPYGLSQAEYMDICFAMTRASDTVYFLKGWLDSEGAVAEYHYAKKIGKVLEYAT